MAEYKSIHARRLREQRLRQVIERADLFNGFSETDKMATLFLYQTKLAQGELRDFGEKLSKAMEYVARLYLAQKYAFQDVLVREGFEIASEAQKDYDGRIATLSNHGTLTMFGKPTNVGRFIKMSRIHSPQWNYDGSRGGLTEDAKLGQCLYFYTRTQGSRRRLGNSSVLRGIAINPKGSGEPELEAHNAQTLMDRIITETYRSVKRPVEDLRKYAEHLEAR
jgi:hypothetical protein